MRRLLVRGDDLGYCEAVNYGIEKSVKEGILRTVGLMPNMESASHGVKLLEGIDICYGLHANICNGKPLTDPKRVSSLVQESGDFKPASAYRQADADFVNLEEALIEVEAQYQRMFTLTGRKPHYLETHAVLSHNFETALKEIASLHDVPFLGFALDKPVLFKNTKLHVSMDSIFPDYDPFESLKRAACREMKPAECVTMICHPGYVDNYVLTTSNITVQRVKEVAMLTSPKTARWLEEKEVQLISYDDL